MYGINHSDEGRVGKLSPRTSWAILVETLTGGCRPMGTFHFPLFLAILMTLSTPSLTANSIVGDDADHGR